jgi:hypothetical protein
MCGSPLTYRARQAAVPRRDGHGSHALPGRGGASVPTLWCVFLFGTGPRGPCNFRKKIRAAVGEFVRGSRDRDLVAYYDSV